MDTYAVAEGEWRKVSNSIDAVEKIRSKYERLLELFNESAKTIELYVKDFSFEVGDATGVLKSFAGESSIRLGWHALGPELDGVVIFSSARCKDEAPIDILKIYLPQSPSRGYMVLEDGARISMDAASVKDFAYRVLMNVVYKQVKLSA